MLQMKMRVLALATVALVAVSLALAGCSAPASASPAITPSGTMEPNPAASATAAASAQTYTGYLVDQLCGISGVDIQDSTDLTKSPEKHQLTCAMMPGCLASGFGLFIKQSDGTYRFYKFDAAGSQLAIDNVINKTKKADNFLVDVNGTMNGDTITVTTITEK
jgi:hypothetical protein